MLAYNQRQDQKKGGSFSYGGSSGGSTPIIQEKDLWKDKTKNIPEPTAFSVKAEELAAKMSEDRQTNKSTQLRKFYDEIFKLNQRARFSGSNWDVVKAQLHMIISKVTYAKARNLVSDDFVNLIKNLIKLVENKDHLNTVTGFLEAFMGFYKLHRPRD